MNGIDLLGLRMTLVEQKTKLTQRPTQGPLRGADGATFWAPFSPKAYAFAMFGDKCCTKVYFGGYARIVWWFVDGSPPNTFGLTYEGHEQQHVKYFKQSFESYNTAAEAYTGRCFSEQKARCYASVITEPLLAFHMNLNDAVNAQFDCVRTPSRSGCEAAAYYRGRSDFLRWQLEQELSICDNMD